MGLQDNPSSFPYPMEISEDAGQTWREMPPWVDYFLKLGLGWEVNKGNRGRVIRLISMPCRSHAASLVALGAVVRDLSSAEANDRSRHLDALFSYAKQHFDHCRSCKIKPCDPKLKRCGFFAEATGQLRLKGKQVNHRFVSEQTDFKKRIFVYKERKVTAGREHYVEATMTVDSPRLFDHYPEGGIPLTDGVKTDPLDGERYMLVPGAPEQIDSNLRTSFSGLCLAGDPGFGRAESKRYYSRFHLKNGQCSSIAELMPISGWGTNKVPRLIFFNTRSRGSYSQEPINPYLVIADGVEAFLRSMEEKRINNSDVIAIVNRDCQSVADEALSTTLSGMQQWFEKSEPLGNSPRGIHVVEYRERNTQ